MSFVCISSIVERNSSNKPEAANPAITLRLQTWAELLSLGP